MPSGCGARLLSPTPARVPCSRGLSTPLQPHTPEACSHPAGRALLPASQKEAEAPAVTSLVPGSSMQGRVGNQWCRHPRGPERTTWRNIRIADI